MDAIKELAIQFFKTSVEKAERTLSFVPADKLTWKPSPTAKSALEIAAHIGVTLMSLSALFEKRGAKPITVQELLDQLKSEEAKYTTLDSVQALIQRGAERMTKALEAIPASAIENESIDTPFGTRPLKRFIFVPESHTHEHAAQIDFLQTVWGDVTPH